MSKSTVIQSAGVPLGTLSFFAAIVMTILKLVGVITWSWWIVWSPVLAFITMSLFGLAVVLFFLGAVAIGALIIGILWR